MKIKSIIVKLMGIMTFALIVIVSIAIFISFFNQLKQLSISTENNLYLTTSILKTILNENIVYDNNKIINDIIKDSKKNEDVKEIIIFDPNGNPIFYSDINNQTIDEIISSKNFKTILSTKKDILVKNLKQKEIEHFLSVYENQNDGNKSLKSEQIRYIIYFKVSITKVYNQIINSLTNLVLSFVILGIILAIIIILNINKIIIKPILTLYKAFKEVGNGNFNINITINGNDEIAELTRYFNNFVKM